MNGIFTSLDDALARVKNVIEHDTYDQYAFADMSERSQKLTELLNAPEAPVPSNLLQDSFFSFYKYRPQFYEDGMISPDSTHHKQIIEKMQNTEEYRKLRDITKLDSCNSAIATAYFGKFFTEQMKKYQPEAQKCQREISELQDQLLQTMVEQQKAEREGDTDTAKQHQQVAETLGQKITVRQKVLANVPQIAVSRAMERATRCTSESTKAIQAFGWGKGEGTLNRLDPQERMKLAQLLLTNTKLLKLLEMLGKMKFIAKSERKEKVKHASLEIHDICLGDDLRHILASELIGLTTPELEDEFLRRYAEKSLMQYELRDRETLGKGGIIVCLDTSGSMAGYKELWAKSVALAALDVAVRERRAYALINFSSTVRRVWQFDISKKPTVEEILEIASESYGGGTDFEQPLKRALEIIQKDEKKNGFDILFVSDGAAELPDKFIQDYKAALEQTKITLVSVLIGARSNSLEQISNHIFPFSNLTEENGSENAGIVFGAMG
jgi:uncharacterized protein with von Willebrand factor type A (vWA) domain